MDVGPGQAPGLQTQFVGMGLDQTQGRLGALLHHLAELASENQPSVTR